MRNARKRRETLWAHMWARHGRVACWVCGRHVPARLATLEHILPKSLGGTNAWCNLAISHAKCNHHRGNRLIAHRAESPA